MGKDVISFQCGCGKSYIVGAQHAGKKVKCKQCGQAMFVPAASRVVRLDSVESVRPSPWRTPPPVAKPAPADDTKGLTVEETSVPVAAPDEAAPETATPDPPGFSQREARALLGEYLAAWREGRVRSFAKARVVNVNEGVYLPTASRIEGAEFDTILKRWRVAVRCTFQESTGLPKEIVLTFDVFKDPDGGMRLSTFDSAA